MNDYNNKPLENQLTVFSRFQSKFAGFRDYA